MTLGGRLLLAARCAERFGDSPKRGAGSQARTLPGERRTFFPVVFLRYEPTAAKSRGMIRAAAFVGEVGPLLQGRCRAEKGVPLLQALRTRPPRCRTGTRCSCPQVGPGQDRPRCARPPAPRSAPCHPQGSRCSGWPTGTCPSSESSVRTPSRKESASAPSKAKWSTRARSRLTTTTR